MKIKTILITVIVLLMMFVMCACGSSKQNTADNTEEWEMTSEEIEKNSEEDFEEQAKERNDEKSAEEMKDATVATSQTDENGEEMWILPEDDQ